MSSSDTTATTIIGGAAAAAAAVISSSFSPPPPTPASSPCAACKILRRRCADKCLLAPYFPPTDPLKFATAHRIFGASNIIKLLQDLPEGHRADAVSSIVYEANARIRDPVYGCAGAICKLQKQACELQAQLARARADLLQSQTQYANLLAILMASTSMPASLPEASAPAFFFDEDAADGSSGHGYFWEEASASLWA